jgi:hypothetical protein
MPNEIACNRCLLCNDAPLEGSSQMLVRVGVCIAALFVIFLSLSSFAQSQPAASARATQQAFQSAKAAFEALPEPERRRIQESLALIGDLRAVEGIGFSRPVFDALLSFQRRARIEATGLVDAKTRTALAAAAKQPREASGFKLIDDERTGVRIGVPERVLPKRGVNPGGGSRWQSADERVTLDTWPVQEAGATLQSLYDRSLSIRAPGRQVTTKRIGPDSFVISGETPVGRFYTQYGSGPDGLRGFSIGYDKALSSEIDPLVVAIAASFVPFPTPPVPSAEDRQVPSRDAAGPRLIATGLAVAPRRIVTAASIETCRDLRVGGRAVKALPVTGPLRIIETDQAQQTASPSLRAAPLTPETALLALFFMLDRGQPSLVAAPALTMPDGTVSGPLQHGAAGAPLFDRSGRLAGFVGDLAPPRFTAGISPSAHHPLVMAAASDALPAAASQAISAGERSAGELAAAFRGAIVPLFCGS